MAKGTIKRYDFRKGFGFIVDDKSGKDLFFHKTEWQGDGLIRQGIAVKFTEKDSDKGPQAEAVIPVDGSSSKPSKNKKPTTKHDSLENRVESLESSLGAWKVVSFLALVGVIALAAEKFLL